MSGLKLAVLGMSFLVLQGCVHKLVTVPVKVAYHTTKGVVKGTVAVADALYETEDEAYEKQKKKELKQAKKKKK